MSPTPIAIVSIGALFPGAPTTPAFWRDLLEGRDRLSEVPRTHWLASDYFDPAPGTPDKVYTTRGGFLSGVEFSPVEFGLPPSTLPAIDTAQLLALVVAKRVLAEATRGRYESMDRSRISVLLGVASATELVAHMSGRLQIPVVEAAMRAAAIPEADARRVRAALEACYVPWQEGTFPGLLGNVVAGRIANRFDLGGTNAVLDAACAGSLAALEMAVQELSLGVADLVITGGVDTLNDILMFMCFAQTGALSRSGECRPFSRDADGTLLSEGIGLFALRRLADAERDGDPVYAVIRGIGTSSDGRATSIYAPLAAGQARALGRAYAQAGVSPTTVGLVEAHGTGTGAGAAAEVEALHQVYAAAGARPKQTAIGSVKGQIGHAKAAAGAAGLAKAALALHHKVLPPTIKISEPLPALADPTSPFYASAATRPWVQRPGQPRRAAVSALGFGGTNFHVVLEEHAGVTPPRLRALPAELVLLGAPDVAALAERCRAEAARLDAPGALVHLARRSQLGFEVAAPVRLAVVAGSEEALADLLRRASEAMTATPRAPLPRGAHLGEGPPPGPVAFLFPGQGSQAVGMGGDLAVHFDDARRVWDEAAGLDPFTDAGLHERVFPPPAFTDEEREAQAGRLTATEWAQPALTCASLALLRLCQRVGLTPVAVGGHSLGEVTALAAGGVIPPLDAVRVARARGALMAEASRAGDGAMAAVPMDRAALTALLLRWQSPVTLANHNAPRQVVVSGERAAITALVERLAAEGVTAQGLPVATAFHSPLVAAACAPFRAALEPIAWAPAAVPVYSNVTAAPYPQGPGAGRDQLAAAVAQPVRFVEQLEAMVAAGVRTFVEVGPGQVLTRLVGRCLEGRPHLAVALDHPGTHGVTALFQALGQLAAAGIALDLAPLWEGQALPEDPAQRAPAKHTVVLNGANHGKPYPAAAEQALARARPPSSPAPTPAPALTPALAPSPALAPTSAPALPALMSDPLKPAPAPLPASDPSGLLTAVRELQAPLIAAQLEYERTMAESHSAFLRAVEASYATLAGSLGAPRSGAAPVAALQALPAAPLAAAPPPAASPPAAPSVMSPPPGRSAPRAEPRPEAPRAEPAKAVPPPPAAAANLPELMLAVVAEKTGYPVEMIDPGMDLESDLGIDSIKRVEILAAVRERVPGLPAIEPARLGKLRTLAEIVRYLEVRGDASASPAAATVPAPARPSTAPAAVAHFAVEAVTRAPLGLAAPGPAEVARFVVEATTVAPLGLATPGLFGAGPLAVIPDDGGVAALLVARLRAQGVEAEVVERVPDGARGVLHLGGLRAVHGPEDAFAVCRDAFEAARVFARRGREGGGLFVTVQDTGGDLGLSGSSGDRAWLAGLAALAKTAAEEWPASSARALDVARGGRDAAQMAEVIAAELLHGGSAREVGLGADGTRRALQEVPAQLASGGRPTLQPGDVVVISGGARGVSAACALALAAAVRPRLVLLGRTALGEDLARFHGLTGDAELKRAALQAAREAGTEASPRDLARAVAQVTTAREVRATLARLAQLGVEARYEAVDVRDAAALAALLADVRARWGAVRGLVHGAGVLADALLEARADLAQFDRVFDTKVRGLAALLAATAGDPLAWICLFSSAAARAGNAGQADYAMANEILNKVAAVEARRRGAGTRVVSLGWGPWEGGMVTPALAQHFTARGVGLLPLDAGAAAFVRESEAPAAGGPAPTEVLLGSARLPSAAAPRRGEVWIDAATHPYLDDHRIRGAAVVPVALALEWLARLVAPDARGAIALADFQVRRGVVLADFGRAGERLQVVATPGSDGAALAILDAAGAVRFAARTEPFAASLPDPAPAVGPPLAGLLYGPDRLFHGPRFQVLDAVSALSPRGGRATLKGTAELGWPGGPWRSDPAALDGALQLALLSSLAAGLGPTLPLAVARVILHERRGGGPLTCVLETRSRSAERAVFDAQIAAADGAPLVDLRGLEMFVAPSGTSGA
jgi:acyl transferase domain-containing protein/NADP-dependent 3-hydroxy acid dehydrogenase YdfG